MFSEWKEAPLGDIITLKRGYDLPARERNQSGGVPIVSSSGISGYHDSAMAKAPGVVTGRYGSVGNFFYLVEDFWPLNTSLYVQDFKGNHPHFVYYLLQILNFAQYSDKTGVPGVNRNDLHRINVKLPPLPEQRKIAEILSTWDEAIDLTEQLIAAKQRRKQALMQRLLTGQVRFPGFEDEWARDKLQNITTIEYGKSPNGIRDDNGRYNIFGTGGIVGKTNIALCNIPAVIIGRKGTIDKPILAEEPFWTIDTTFYCLPKQETGVQWLYYALSQIDLKQYNEASGVPSLSRNTLYNIELQVPPMAEQRKIADLLLTCDQEIDLLQQKLTALRRQKQGLMQQLLTGKVRVQV